MPCGVLGGGVGHSGWSLRSGHTRILLWSGAFPALHPKLGAPWYHLPPASGSGLPPTPGRLQETSEDAAPPLPPFHFQQLLANLTALRIRAGGQSTSPSGQ